ncbi:MAG: GNAT family N-acetyltransferase [Pseudomonadales bacterium]|nr:GNAT family N-acetyltransferase [Pseudomonadales bacterium]
MDVHVVKVAWLDKHESLKEIRFEVFVTEQNVPIEEELDGFDETSTHFLALNDAGQTLGCARLMNTGQIGRMAVRKSQRGTGLGAELLAAAVAEAKTQGMNKVFLHAQTYAEDFYRKGGFVGLGDRFMDAGIEHTTMEMMLPLQFASPDAPIAQPVSKPFVATKPLPVSAPKAFDGMEQARNALLTALSASTRQLLILSPYLDHELFADEDIVQTISNHARSAPSAEVRILIMSSKYIVSRGHALVELARRLDQKISLRLFDEPVTLETSSFVCIDNNGYWLLPEHSVPTGVADAGNPVTTKRFIETFETAWEKSRPDPELRQLRL